MLGEVETELERTGHGHAVEVLLEVAQHFGVVGARGEDVDEPEQLGLELRVGHRPGQHPLAPPSEMEDPRLVVTSAVGRQLPRNRGDLRLELQLRCVHRPE